MNIDNPIKIALIISVIFHSVIFFAWPSLKVFFPKRPQKISEITYYRIVQSRPMRAIKQSPQQQQLRKINQVKKSESTIQTPAEKEKPKNLPPKQEELTKKEPASPVKQDLVIPPVPAGVEKMPAYLDYVQAVREKIKRVANLRYKRLYAVGDVMLNFVLTSDGNLRILRIVDERSVYDQRLRDVAEAAIKEAAPFDQFPADLEFRELSFSVVISFQ